MYNSKHIHTQHTLLGVCKKKHKHAEKKEKKQNIGRKRSGKIASRERQRKFSKKEKKF